MQNLPGEGTREQMDKSLNIANNAVYSQSFFVMFCLSVCLSCYFKGVSFHLQKHKIMYLEILTAKQVHMIRLLQGN